MPIHQLDLGVFRYQRTPRPVFEEGAEGRALRVVVDARLFRPSPDPELRLLCQLAEKSPSDLELVALEMPGVALGTLPAPVRRMTVQEPDLTHDQVPILLELPDGTVYFGIDLFKQWERVARTELGQFNRPVEKKVPEVIRALAAQAWPADVFVTHWDLLLKSNATWISRANPMTQVDALALAGLLLRSRGKFTLAPVDAFIPTSFPPDLCYWAAARAVLPASFRYFSAAISTRAVGERASMVDRLAETAIMRAARALVARDRLMGIVQQRHGHAANFEVLYHLDAFLVQFVGAFDALARVADLAAHLCTEPLQIGWQSKTWREALAEKTQAFAGALVGGAPERTTVELIGCMRNNIHGDALRAVPKWAKNDEPRCFAISLPDRDRSEIALATARLGGQEAWGLHESRGGEIHADVAKFVEQATKTSMSTINSLMECTPMESLPGFDRDKVTAAPPPDDPAFGSGIAHTLRLTFGLS